MCHQPSVCCFCCASSRRPRRLFNHRSSPFIEWGDEPSLVGFSGREQNSSSEIKIIQGSLECEYFAKSWIMLSVFLYACMYEVYCADWFSVFVREFPNEFPQERGARTEHFCVVPFQGCVCVGIHYYTKHTYSHPPKKTALRGVVSLCHSIRHLN